jgi:hypothetical protein
VGPDGNLHPISTDNLGNLNVNLLPGGTITANQGLPALIANAWPVYVATALPAGANVIGSVNQGTSPWIIDGTISNFPATYPVTQSTSPWVVSGTVTANQGTNPWVISGSVVDDGYISGNPPTRLDYTVTPVTTAAYTQLVASIATATKEIEIFDSSGQTLYLATGAPGSEVDQILIFPGGNGRVRLIIPLGSRVSIKSVSATASDGEIDVNWYS